MADNYGPDVSEKLIREALHPYEGLLIATKAGLTRPGPYQWIANGRPAYLIAQAKGSLMGSAPATAARQPAGSPEQEHCIERLA
jgi:hypothetical protein